MTDYSAFTEYGLAGLVIAALFTTIAVMAKIFMSHLDRVSERNQEHVDAIMEQHRVERKSWVEEETKRTQAWAEQEMKRAEIFRASLDRAVDKIATHG
jgi:uncharacterized membrane protein YhiD involved in acid resistance